jgi:hypothetical protein
MVRVLEEFERQAWSFHAPGDIFIFLRRLSAPQVKTKLKLIPTERKRWTTQSFSPVTSTGEHDQGEAPQHGACFRSR